MSSYKPLYFLPSVLVDEFRLKGKSAKLQGVHTTLIPMNLALMKTFVLSPFNSFGLAAFLLTLLTIIFVTPSKAELVFGMTIFFNYRFTGWGFLLQRWTQIAQQNDKCIPKALKGSPVSEKTVNISLATKMSLSYQKDNQNYISINKDSLILCCIIFE